MATNTNTPSQQQINALGRIIPMQAGTVTFEHEFLLLASPNGDLHTIGEAMLGWGPEGAIDRVRRTIAIAVGELEIVEHLQVASKAVTL